MSIAEYDKQLQALNETLWENKALRPNINRWLNNFKPEEQISAIQLLSHMMYFNAFNIRILLKSLYRDLYSYPVIKKIREENNDTLDANLIKEKFDEELNRTLFLGVGNPSESGVHLLYYFRQENKLKKSQFANTDDVIVRDVNPTFKIHNKFNDITHYVFIDDLCATGSQVTSDTNIRRFAEEIRKIKQEVKISYYMLFGTEKGIHTAKTNTLFNNVEAVITLDESYKCFSNKSRYFSDAEEREKAKNIAYNYGYKLMSEYVGDNLATVHALGYKNCQLLLSMYHNTPDNTLPIIWFDEIEGLWTPIFKRYNKV